MGLAVGSVVVAGAFLATGFASRMPSRWAGDARAGRARAVPAVHAPLGPASIHLSISAMPSQARLYLDGAEVGNPLEIERRPDDLVHALRAEAPGYKSIARALRLQRDLTIQLELATLPAETAHSAPTTVVLLPADQIRSANGH
jgi:hypothetical protein